VYLLAISSVFLCTTIRTADSAESISECNNDKKVPYRVIVYDDGHVEISCRYVDCVNASNENPQCESKWHGHSCKNFPQWVHGVRQPSGYHGGLQTKCCTYDRLVYGRYLGSTVLRKHQGFLGGFSYIRGQENSNHRDGFDVVTNITKEGDGFRIWVYRMRCIPPPPQQQKPNQDYPDTKPHGGNPNIDYQQVETRDAKGNPVSVPVVYSSGCFDGQTTVHSKTRGSIRMDELVVGEQVLTVHRKTAAYRPVTFFLHRDPKFTARYLTLHTEREDVSVTMTPYHITYSDSCTQDPTDRPYPQKYANEVRVGDCLLHVDRDTGRVERVRVSNISESYRKGIYSPITPNGVIVTNDLVSSCYSFIKNQDLQVTIFYYMMRLEEYLQYYFAVPIGWLLGGEQTKVDVPRGLDYILTALDYILPVSKVI